MTLFRPEAIDYSSVRRYGTVILARPISFSFLTALCLLFTILIAAFFALVSYTNKAQVSGIILPNLGVARIIALQAGVVRECKVREGQLVKAGDILFVLTSERASATDVGTESNISALMRSRHDSLQTEQAQQRQQSIQRIEATVHRAADLSADIQRIDEQRTLQERRVALAEKSLQRNADLQASNFISPAALQDRTAELLDQQQRLADLVRARSSAERDLANVRADLRDLTLQAQRDKQVAQRSIATIDQEITENEARRQVFVRAAQSGFVTAITAELGQTVTLNQTLATVLPADATMFAELYVPSRSAGFIKPGMEVMLRYQAFPYQKFGQHGGRVRDVSNIAVRLEELPLPVAGLSSGEPLYRVRVNLDRQTVTAYGVVQPLRSGMALEASILLDRRKLYEWVLEPLYSITGRT